MWGHLSGMTTGARSVVVRGARVAPVRPRKAGLPRTSSYRGRGRLRPGRGWGDGKRDQLTGRSRILSFSWPTSIQTGVLESEVAMDSKDCS